MTSITEPGVYDGVPHEDYHHDPVPAGSLSSTQLKWLTPPSCPALFRWNTDHPEEREVTEGMEIGQAYHTLAFGVGPRIVEVDAPDWRTKAAQAARDEARAVGETPILTGKLAEVRAMVEVLRADPIARDLLADGRPEQSFFWQEREGIWGRGRVDWLPNATTYPLIVPDLKSAETAEPYDFGRGSATRYGYAQSADWYLRGLRALGLADKRSTFVLIVQEKRPPYIVQPMQLDDESMRAAQVLNDRALDLYARCRESGEWPRYEPGIATARLAQWLINEVLDDEIEVS